MAHSSTTMDLGGIRPSTNETAKRPGFSRAPAMLTLAVALGLAVGAGAWAIATTRTTTRTTDPASAAAIHERIEAHQAAVAAGADRSNDQIEAHRMAAANAAAGVQANTGSDQIEAHRTLVANQAAGAFDHRLDDIVHGYGLPAATTTGSTRGIVPDLTKSSPTWHAATIVGAAPAPLGRAYSQGVVVPAAPRVFDPGAETPDTRDGVPTGIGPDPYRPYIESGAAAVTDGVAAGADATAGFPWKYRHP